MMGIWVLHQYHSYGSSSVLANRHGGATHWPQLGLPDATETLGMSNWRINGDHDWFFRWIRNVPKNIQELWYESLSFSITLSHWIMIRYHGIHQIIVRLGTTHNIRIHMDRRGYTQNKTGWWFGTFFYFFHILGMSSSQLTNSFFSEG